jgi:methyl-accepting chemotaxis protein
MSIKFKLYSSFGVLVILTLGLALYVVQVFGGVGYQVTRMDGIAENTTRTLLTEVYLESLRRSVLRYAYDQDEASKKENADIAAKTLTTLQAAEQATPSDERKRMYREIQEELATVQRTTQALFDVVQQSKADQAKLSKAGGDLSARTNALLAKVQAESDPAITALVMKLDSQLSMVRVISMRGQVLRDVDSKPALADAVSKAQATIGELQKSGAEDVRSQLAPVGSALNDFHTTVGALVDRLHQINDLFINKISPPINDMQQKIRTLRQQLQENFEGTRNTVETSIASTVLNQKIIGTIVLLIGALIAFVVARSVSNPISALTKAMRELAQGKFDVALPGLSRKDEIGNIAKAVDEFKVKAAEKAQREAEEKADQDKRADVERQTALAKMADEFQAVVGGIVAAAAAGDFSERVDLEGKTGLVLNVGTLINSLCDNIGKALNDLVQMLSALAQGDLTKRIVAEYQGDFAALKSNANATAEQLSSTIADIKTGAREVHNAAAEISASTTDLSQRTEEQAASLEQTSASMEEISATVKKNAENAQRANQLTSSSREVADRGGSVVADAVKAMARIEESSRKIADIIGVIDEIARQTNLLALNAAVEAARAGDAGRGFAVVASEVRSLAQRSSQAAKDIKDLITSSSGQVQDGVGLVNQAGTSLSDIVNSIKQVAEIVADIATASSEQAEGLEQINKALTQMDEVTQQNSALVEQNAASAKALEQQSTTMDERVAFFQLESGSAAPAGSEPVKVASRAAAGGRKVAAASVAEAPQPQAAAAPAKAHANDQGRDRSKPRPKVVGDPGTKSVGKVKDEAWKGPVGRMQAMVATAFQQEPDWKEF